MKNSTTNIFVDQANFSEKFKQQYERSEVAAKLELYNTQVEEGSSQRQAVETINIPRSTVQYWLKRQSAIGLTPGVVRFLESPEGYSFLHRIIFLQYFVFKRKVQQVFVTG